MQDVGFYFALKGYVQPSAGSAPLCGLDWSLGLHFFSNFLQNFLKKFSKK